MIALIAGEGQYPLLFAKAVKEAGKPLLVVTFNGHANHSLAQFADRYYVLPLTKFGKLLKVLKENDAQEVAFAGRIRKSKVISEAKPDLKTILLWRKLRTRNDDDILRLAAEEIEKTGAKVISPTKYLPELLTPAGILTRKKPNKKQLEDIIYGFSIAKAIGELDIGQCVVVKDRMVVAVEALEGTDATIARAGKLLKDTVVVKVFKPTQDPRFDLPSAGLDTIKEMIAARAKVLALEAHRSLFFNREEALSLADKNGIVVVGVRYE